MIKQFFNARDDIGKGPWRRDASKSLFGSKRAGRYAMKVLGVSGVPLASGCSGYILGDRDTFERKLTEQYPVGSSADALVDGLAKKGFENAPFRTTKAKTASREEQCMQRGIAYGFWAGGDRVVCHVRTSEGSLTSFEVYDIGTGL